MPVDENLAYSLKRSLASGKTEDCERFIALAQPIIASAILRILLRRRKPDRQRVDDLVQDTFAKLYQRDAATLRSFRGGSSAELAAWLRSVAASLALDFLRSQSAQKYGSGFEDRSIEDPALNLRSPENTAVRVERSLMIEQIGRCLESQKERDRSIFWLYYRHGFTARNIADIPAIAMGIKGVESTILRVTRAVRDCVGNAIAPKTAAAEGGRT